MPSTEQRVRAFFRDTFPVFVEPGSCAADALDAERSLFEAGVLDSIGVLTLVAWLEQEFKMVVDEEDVVPENIDGIARLVRYIDAKRADVQQP